MRKLLAFVKHYSILLFLILLFGFSCARVGRPTGGEKDILPPITISASPDFESLNFEGNKIKINFNEYIKFDDLNTQLVISPPLKFSPEISPMGFPSKQITIKIKDTLKPNTTYTFNFGNAITDNSEGNPLKRFKYLFSTGDHIDSLEIAGTIQDAFLSEPPQNISVLLYEADSTYTDSIIFNKKPNYVTNTLDSIGFSLTNLKDGKYYLVGINDSNKNLLFDPKTEKIGFIENPIEITQDTIYKLNLFLEEPEFAVKSVSELSKNHILIGYEGKLNTSINTVKDTNSNAVSFISYKDEETDSLHVWHKKVETDSLFIVIKQKDSLTNFTQHLRSKEIDSIQIKKSIANTLHQRDSLFIVSNTPIALIENDKITLIDKDSVAVPFRINRGNLPNRFHLDFDKKEATTYTLSILPEAITDFLEQKNDSLQFKFNTKDIAEYGNIELEVMVENTNMIIELLTEKGELNAREFIDNTKKLNFKFLPPKKYQIRAIIDGNNNKKWDTGSYLRKTHPEKVIYYPNLIEVRANWTISEVFNLK